MTPGAISQCPAALRRVDTPSCIAITGAGGFIGGRLAQLLVDRPGVDEVRAFSRRITKGRNTQLLRLDDTSSIRRALVECGALVHCAFDDFDRPSNLRIARILGEACADAQIRMIHISTAAIYEPLPDGHLDERFPTYGADTYKAVKIAIEDELLRLTRERRLDLVILQPTIVYGPGGRAWTDSPVRDLLMGSIVLPDHGKGFCNAVFVDDVCQAAINALSADVPTGERFLISGPGPVTWYEFFTAYHRMIGGVGPRLDADLSHNPAAPPSPSLPPKDNRRVAGPRLKAFLKRAIFGRLHPKIRSHLNIVWRQIGRVARDSETSPRTGFMLSLYSARCVVGSEKARAHLGYCPNFDLDRGMAMTIRYVQTEYARQIARRA